VLDELSLMGRLAAGATAGHALGAITQRDPICGMAIQSAGETLPLDGITLKFCSRQCRDKFTTAPDRYLRLSEPATTPAGAHLGAP
jgi:YHS domain-containing protein